MSQSYYADNGDDDYDNDDGNVDDDDYDDDNNDGKDFDYDDDISDDDLYYINVLAQ